MNRIIIKTQHKNMKEKKKQEMVTITRLEYRRLKKCDEREIKMKTLVIQLASYFRNKKIVRSK
jgi:DNA-binding Xre family transcriptional regulator